MSRPCGDYRASIVGGSGGVFRAIVEAWFLRKTVPCLRCSSSGESARRFVYVAGRPAVCCLGCGEYGSEGDGYTEATDVWNRENRPIVRRYQVILAGHYGITVER